MSDAIVLGAKIKINGKEATITNIVADGCEACDCDGQTHNLTLQDASNLLKEYTE